MSNHFFRFLALGGVNFGYLLRLSVLYFLHFTFIPFDFFCIAVSLLAYHGRVRHTHSWQQHGTRT